MVDHFGILAPVYEWVIGPPDPDEWRELLRLPARGRLLDAGGGTGRVSAQVGALVDSVVISDVSARMLQQARRKGNVTVLQAASEQLPFGDGSFARIMVVDALHHFEDQERAVRELLRVLAPGGRLVIEEPDINRGVVKAVALAERLALMRSRFLSPEDIRALVAGTGVAVQVESDGRFSARIVADRN
jgi:SAM-dependent methyltransferase